MPVRGSEGVLETPRGRAATQKAAPWPQTPLHQHILLITLAASRQHCSHTSSLEGTHSSLAAAISKKSPLQPIPCPSILGPSWQQPYLWPQKHWGSAKSKTENSENHITKSLRKLILHVCVNVCVCAVCVLSNPSLPTLSGYSQLLAFTIPTVNNSWSTILHSESPLTT